MRTGSRRWRWPLAWVAAIVLTAAGLAVAVLARDLRGWLAAAALGGVAAVIATVVQATAKRGLETGRALLVGAPSPVVVSVEYWQQPLLFIRSSDPNGPGREVRCGFVVLLVEAVGDQAVVLKHLRVIIDSRVPGVPVTPDPSHAPLPLRKFLVDLDAEVPQPKPGGTPDFPYTVSPHDPEYFEVMGYTDRHDVRWRLALDWVCAGRTGTTTIDHDGRPFRVSRPAPPGGAAGQ